MANDAVAPAAAPPKAAPKPLPRKPKRSMLRMALDDSRVVGWTFLIALLAVWEFVVIRAGISPLYLPRPTRVVAVLWENLRDGDLAVDIGLTMYRIFAGFIIALVTGVLLGVWMAVSKPVKAMADMLIAALYPLPKVTLIPLLVIWLGTGGPFMLTISFMGAFFPIVINTVVGVQQCDPGLILAARDLRASMRQIVLRVLIPSAVPSIFAGIRIGLGISIILVVAAEMVIAKDGLGAKLFIAGQLLDTELVFAVLLVLALLGIVITKGQDLIDDRLGLWRTN